MNPARRALRPRAPAELLIAELPDGGAGRTEIVTALRDDVLAFADGAEPPDDLTLLALRWNGGAGRRGARRASAVRRTCRRLSEQLISTRRLRGSETSSAVGTSRLALAAAAASTRSAAMPRPDEHLAHALGALRATACRCTHGRRRVSVWPITIDVGERPLASSAKTLVDDPLRFVGELVLALEEVQRELRGRQRLRRQRRAVTRLDVLGVRGIRLAPPRPTRAPAYGCARTTWFEPRVTVSAVSCPEALGSSTIVSFGAAQAATSSAAKRTAAVRLLIDRHDELGAANAQHRRRRAHGHRLRRLLGDAARDDSQRAAPQLRVEAALVGGGVELEAFQ